MIAVNNAYKIGENTCTNAFHFLGKETNCLSVKIANVFFLRDWQRSALVRKIDNFKDEWFEKEKQLDDA